MHSKGATDEVLESLGTHGKYQMLQYGYILISMIPMTYPVLIRVFAGHIPDFRCNNVTHYGSQYDIYLNNTDFYVQYDKCDVTIYNQTGNSTKTKIATTKCKDGRTFDVDDDETIISEWNLVCDKKGLSELSITLVILGQLFGSVAFTSLADLYGRLTVSYVTHIIFFIASVCLAFVPIFELFVVLGVIIGATQTGASLAQFTTAVEIFPTHRRGAVMFVYAIGWSLACCALPLIAYLLRNTSWRYLQLTAGLLSFHSVFSRWIQNESLRWLVANEKKDQVRQWIRSAAKVNNKDPEKIIEIIYPGDENTQENEILVSASAQSATNCFSKDTSSENDASEVSVKVGNGNALLDICRKRLLLRYTLIMCTALFVNNMTYYGLFLTSAVMPGSRYVNFFLGSIAEIPGCILFYAIVDRSFGLGASCVAGTIGGMISPYSSILASRIIWGPGAIFGIGCIVVTFLTLLLPETKGRELPQTYEDIESWNTATSDKQHDNIHGPEEVFELEVFQKHEKHEK